MDQIIGEEDKRIILTLIERSKDSLIVWQMIFARDSHYNRKNICLKIRTASIVINRTA